MNNDNNNMTKDYYGTVDVDKHRREPSFGFSNQTAVEDEEDPPTRLIHQFLSQQKHGDIALDMDLEMNELQPNQRSSIRVSLDPSVSDARADAAAAAESLHRRHNKDSYNNNNPPPPPTEAGVIRCTSNSSFRNRASSLSRLKTKSRLLDPPEDRIERMLGLIMKSGQLQRSGMLSKSGDEDDDDELELEDLPEDFNSAKMNISIIVQWVILIAIVVSLICSLVIPSLERKRIVHLRLWKWEVLLLVLICGRLVSGWGIRILVYLVERNFLLRKRVLYFVYGVKNAVQNCLWLGLVLAAWMVLFDKRVEQEAKGRVQDLKYLTKVWICCLVANFIWLLKTLLVKVLASSFHVSTYFDRIQESLFNQYVIETLSGPPLIEQLRIRDDVEWTAAEVAECWGSCSATAFPGPHNLPSSDGKAQLAGKSFKSNNSSISKLEKSKGEAADSKKHTITIDHLHQLNTKNVSAWNMKRLINIVRHGSLSTLDERIQQGAANRFGVDEDDHSRKIKSEYQGEENLLQRCCS